MALAENRSLADFNLSREPRLREGRAQLARLHQEARGVRDIYDKDRRQLGEYCGNRLLIPRWDHIHIMQFVHDL